MLAVFQQFGATEILIILAILLVLFGAKKLPELGKGLGKGIQEFREGVKGVNEGIEEGLKDDGSKASPTDGSTSVKGGDADAAPSDSSKRNTSG